ncbi:P-loop containing nucleoside triphosphate hydrolase protein [Pelagophyceae sp. CCMP2097]|nr:P-loop containing nucleoside triphosphate hydrolase protein [Pelagophyceae sp. CCMP2097]
MNLLKSRAKVQYEPVTGIDFSVIAGCDESKRELQEVVEFLKHPQKFNKLGAVCPRGVILEGPPGTGKTLLARAVAGEAGVPFIAASGSEFIEMFVGVGASRIRSMFADAMRSAPCIIFIDEIDAIGRKRAASGGFMGANDEREQTLNQILSELDGFHGNTGVIVIAATNRADVLDPALLRPGRFDRRIPIPLPDRIGREAILEVHARGKALGPDVDLAAISARTTGFSGAMLENLLNEAAIYAVRGNKDSISADHVEAALDRLTLGLQRVSSAANVKRREVVAWHEAGHAAMALLAPGYDTVAKVSIVPRISGIAGATLFTPMDVDDDVGLHSLHYLKDQLAVALGGRCAPPRAEELAFGADDVTTGASDDLQHVRTLAHRMEFMGGPRTASPRIASLIDEEAKLLIDEAHKRCAETLEKHRALVEAIVADLLEHETVSGDTLTALVLEHTARPAFV